MALSMPACAQGKQQAAKATEAKADTLPYTYKSFMAQKDVKVTKGLNNADGLALNIYQIGDKYYLEIPRKALGRDILVLAMSHRGSSYLSPASGTFKLKEGANKHSLYLTYNRSLDTQADSTHAKAANAAMMEAIHASNMEPIDMSLTVVSRGEDGKSYIVDISSNINSAPGLFDVSKNSSLNHPDMSRSRVLSIDAISGGAVFDLYRSQSDMVNVTMTAQAERATTTPLRFVLQILPNRKDKLKLNCPFYGFNTFERQEYDTKAQAICEPMELRRGTHHGLYQPHHAKAIQREHRESVWRMVIGPQRRWREETVYILLRRQRRADELSPYLCRLVRGNHSHKQRRARRQVGRDTRGEDRREQLGHG